MGQVVVVVERHRFPIHVRACRRIRRSQDWKRVQEAAQESAVVAVLVLVAVLVVLAIPVLIQCLQAVHFFFSILSLIHIKIRIFSK